MRSTMLATALALSTLFAAAPAFAHGEAKRERPQFPMPAAAFKERIDARQAKARERMERRASKLDAERAKQLRAEFNAGVAKVNAEVAKATADGTVTKEEAKAVRSVMRAGPIHSGRGMHGKTRDGERRHKGGEKRRKGGERGQKGAAPKS